MAQATENFLTKQRTAKPVCKRTKKGRRHGHAHSNALSRFWSQDRQETKLCEMPYKLRNAQEDVAEGIATYDLEKAEAQAAQEAAQAEAQAKLGLEPAKYGSSADWDEPYDFEETPSKELSQEDVEAIEAMFTPLEEDDNGCIVTEACPCLEELDGGCTDDIEHFDAATELMPWVQHQPSSFHKMVYGVRHI